MEVRITTLIENNMDDHSQLIYEHGLSLYIEADGKKILFDTGESGAFVDNAKSLNIDLQSLDFCIISHGHYDHSGGVKKFISEMKIVPPFVVGDEFFRPKYKTTDVPGFKYNGNSFDEEFMENNQISLRKIKEGVVYLTEKIIVFHHFSRDTDYEKRNNRFFIKEHEEYIPDNFDDEIALGMITKKGLVVIVGCSHVGIVNILKTISKRVTIPIYAVIGGTHLIEADEQRIRHTIEAFKEMDIQLLALSHCTGEEGIRLIREEREEQFLYNNTGNVIEI